jgi:hypothetical protein
MEVYVYKTSVKKSDFKFVKPFLEKLLLNEKWNFDFADCDKILRIESITNYSTNVCDSLMALGYLCEELE